MAKDDDLLTDAKDAFQRAEEHEADNRIAALDDLRFAKLGEQWPEPVRQQRVKDGRPCLTINRQPAFIRQVVNEARQNRPSIRVHPVDSDADVHTAEIYNGLIRNIEQTSKADVAYDTAVDFAVSMGFGYFRIDTDYACDDSFDLDILINRISNPFSVYGDPLSTAFDSSDWNEAFVVEVLGKDAFQAKYKGADPVDWESTGYTKLQAPWWQDQSVQVAEWWKREKVPTNILMLSNGTAVEEGVYKDQKDFLDSQQITVLGERQTSTYKVTQRVMTGVEILETNDWAGKYIPIVPVYGDEVNVEGKRHFRSLIRDAKDAQRMLNYWRTASTELTALAPRVPFIGKKGTFKSDAKKWATVNSQNHAFVEFDGDEPPQRQPLAAGQAIGAIQEALNAQDDMKAILGIYDASLGAQGNETSGRAILARQKEGDVSNFHFLDNLSRAIEHAGRVVIDLIPKVYTTGRIVRTLGADLRQSQMIPLGQPVPVGVDQQTGQAISKTFDLAAGKYDLTVETGPSYGSRREETADQILNLIQAYPPAAPILGDILAKNLDWPEADEVARRLQALLPPQLQASGQNGQPANPFQHPAVQAVMQQGQQQIQGQAAEIQQLTQTVAMLQQKVANQQGKLEIEAFEAQTDRARAIHEISQPTHLPTA